MAFQRAARKHSRFRAGTVVAHLGHQVAQARARVGRGLVAGVA